MIEVAMNSGMTSMGLPSASIAGEMSNKERTEAAMMCSIDSAICAPGHILDEVGVSIEKGEYGKYSAQTSFRSRK